MNTQYLELARKLKALADRGEQGERFNAEQRLNVIMKKYGIKMSDLEVHSQVFTRFNVPLKRRELFMAVAFSVTGLKRRWGYYKKKKTQFVSEVTKLEEAEIRAKFNFYQKEYDQSYKIFEKAFIVKNNLLPTDFDGERIELTWEQRLEAQRVLELAGSIKRSQYYTPITQNTGNSEK